MLASHLTVSTGIFSGSEKCAVFGNDPVLLPSQLAIKPFDYVALGHLHRHQNLNKNGYPAVVYAGSTERVDFGERKEPKGFCKVTIHHSSKKKVDASLARHSPDRGDGGKECGVERDCVYEFIPLNVRPMIQIEVKLEPDKDQTEQIRAALEKRDLARAIIKIVYHLPAGKQDTVDLLAVQRACAAAHHIAGIIPIHKPVVHERRAALNVNMDFQTTLSSYLDTKEMAKEEKKNLLEKAKQLFNEVGDGEN